MRAASCSASCILREAPVRTSAHQSRHRARRRPPTFPDSSRTRPCGRAPSAVFAVLGLTPDRSKPHPQEHRFLRYRAARRRFFAIAGADILAFAMLRSIFTSVFDHARMTRRFNFFFAMDISGHKPRIIPERIIPTKKKARRPPQVATLIGDFPTRSESSATCVVIPSWRVRSGPPSRSTRPRPHDRPFAPFLSLLRRCSPEHVPG